MQLTNFELLFCLSHVDKETTICQQNAYRQKGEIAGNKEVQVSTHIA